VQVWEDGRKYEGEFKENLMWGFGTYKFKDGKTYEGYYHKDLKHGYGVYSWTDGKKYSGWWVLGKQDGYGIYIEAKKSDGNQRGAFNNMKYGIWKEGKKLAWLDDDALKNV
jgi:hypothetical protein